MMEKALALYFSFDKSRLENITLLAKQHHTLRFLRLLPPQFICNNKINASFK
jgi:pectin methylesterase-like acyl-CoA thioesterase